MRRRVEIVECDLCKQPKAAVTQITLNNGRWSGTRFMDVCTVHLNYLRDHTATEVTASALGDPAEMRQCQYCDRRFRSVQAVSMHTFRMHNDEWKKARVA